MHADITIRISKGHVATAENYWRAEVDYAMKNSYQALDDASVDVSAVLRAMVKSGKYRGDHHTDQTGGKQHLAGFGWGRSTQDAGIEDWGFQHPNQAIICSDNEGVPPRTMPTRKCWKKRDGTYKIGGVSIQCRNWVGYALWDNDSSKNNNLPGIGNIGSIRSQCAKMGLGAVRNVRQRCARARRAPRKSRWLEAKL
eukprot:COSAG01_NODE_16894_length_1195_cov_2.024635_1_plen_197_part_00